jgi:predicted amidohydrolase YtcJ
MLEPYSDRPDTTGSSLVNASTLTSLATNWARLGYQVNIHAIGDLANRWAIDALEAALKTTYPSSSSFLGNTPSTSNLKTHQQIDKRHRIEHSQITSPPDQLRLHALGIIPSIQPTHATSDMLYALSRLGHKRLEDSAYRMKSLLPLHPILGSDFPVEPPNPFHGMYAAVARKSPGTGLAVDLDGLRGVNASWYASEALSVQQALQGFTASPARGAFLEGKAGVLQKGAWADWVVLEEGMQPRRWEESIEMLRTGVSQGVLETWVGGRKVYDRALDGEGPLVHVPGAHAH